MRRGRSEVSGHYDHAFNVICNSVIRSVRQVEMKRNDCTGHHLPEAGITTKPRN